MMNTAAQTTEVESGRLPFGRDGYISWKRTSRQYLELVIVDEGIEAARKKVPIMGGPRYRVPFVFNGALSAWQGAHGELTVWTNGAVIRGLTVRLTPTGPAACEIQLFPPYRAVARLLDCGPPGLLPEREDVLSELEIPLSDLQILLMLGDAATDATAAEYHQLGRVELGQHMVYWEYRRERQWLDTVIRHTRSGDVMHASRRIMQAARRCDEFRMEAKNFDVASFSYNVVTEVLLDATLSKVLRYDLTLSPVVAGIRYTLFNAATG
jgi:hypothetical protein